MPPWQSVSPHCLCRSILWWAPSVCRYRAVIYISMMLSSARQQFCWTILKQPSSLAAWVLSWAIYFFYPTPIVRFFWLLTAFRLLLSASWHTAAGKVSFKGAALGVILGAVIMVVGYSLGRAFIYSTPHYAYIKLPYQILQAAVGAVGGLVLCFKAGLLERFDKMVRK